MKKLSIFLVFLIVATMAFGQYKLNKVVSVPTATSKLGTNLFAGDHVYCTATGNEYILKTNQGGASTVTTIVASGNYTLLTTYSATPTLTTLTLTGLATLPWIHATHTLITNDSVTNLVASTLAKAPTVSVATTLNLPGTANTVVKTVGNPNSITFAHSVTVTDTSRPATLAVTGNGSVSGTLLASGALTASVLPSFTIAAGTATPVLVGDTVGFAVAGLTTGAIVIVCPAAGLATTDSVPYVKQCRTGWLTLGGKHSTAINYWIPKK